MKGRYRGGEKRKKEKGRVGKARKVTIRRCGSYSGPFKVASYGGDPVLS